MTRDRAEADLTRRPFRVSLRRKPAVLRTTVEVHASDGTVDRVERPMMLLPTAEGTCPDCGVTHDPGVPHNRDSLHYQYAFYAEHGRWPTWADAVSHCTFDVQTAWQEELERRGAWSEP